MSLKHLLVTCVIFWLSLEICCVEDIFDTVDWVYCSVYTQSETDTLFCRKCAKLAFIKKGGISGRKFLFKGKKSTQKTFNRRPVQICWTMGCLFTNMRMARIWMDILEFIQTFKYLGKIIDRIFLKRGRTWTLTKKDCRVVE